MFPYKIVISTHMFDFDINNKSYVVFTGLKT